MGCAAAKMQEWSMNPITYSLRADQRRSDRFYRDIAAFTDEVIARLDQVLGQLVTDVRTHDENPRTGAEYLYELLVLGVLWRVYGNRALRLARSPQRVMSLLSRWRQRGSAIQPVVDALRGVLATIFLAPGGYSPDGPTALTPAHMERLLGWLDATGDFTQEVERLRVWHTLFAGQSADGTRRHLTAVAACADWFTHRSLEALGSYTPRVEAFLAETRLRYRWREDVIFCGRQRVEYHLGMVGTEIMNRAFREVFLAAPRKVVLLPPCMRAHPADECQAKETGLGAQCAGCEPGCHVHQVTKLGAKHGFGVYMLPDDLASLAPGAGSRAGLNGLGVVGVSCPLTNPQGGWKTRALGIPAQGLLLDYCGCSWHWHPDGAIPTDINFRQLLRLLETAESQPSEQQPAAAIP
jgi:hypothetical protein